MKASIAIWCKFSKVTEEHSELTNLNEMFV